MTEQIERAIVSVTIKNRDAIITLDDGSRLANVTNVEVDKMDPVSIGRVTIKAIIASVDEDDSVEVYL